VEALLQLLEFGLKPHALARMLLGLVERLALRRLCPHCRAARTVTPEEAALLALSTAAPVWESHGCDICGDGFLGRRMLYGVWPMDEALTGRIRAIDPAIKPTIAALTEWRNSNPLSVSVAAREAVLAGEVTFADAQLLLTPAVTNENGS
jgi:general secretion pathway protein E